MCATPCLFSTVHYLCIVSLFCACDSDMAPNASGLQQVDHEQIVVGAHIPYKFLLRMVYSA